VVWVRVSFSADLADAPNLPVEQPTNYAALPHGWDELPAPPQESDLIITKRQWSAFYGTELDLQLRRREMRCIVLGAASPPITGSSRLHVAPRSMATRWSFRGPVQQPERGDACVQLQTYPSTHRSHYHVRRHHTGVSAQRGRIAVSCRALNAWPAAAQ
jgi:hypothetical protein